MKQKDGAPAPLCIEAELSAYRQRAPLLAALEEQLRKLLEEALRALGITEGIVTGRVKSPHSVVGKLRANIRNSAYQGNGLRIDALTDQVGVRVLVPASVDIGRLESWLRQPRTGLWIDPENHRRDEDVLSQDAFGYRSRHVIVALDGQDARWNRLRKPFRAGLTAISPMTGAPAFRAEIQLRTFAAHAWAIMAHDQFYKTEGGRPRELARSSAKAAALLEAADDELSRLLWEVEAYHSSVPSIRSRASIEGELGDLAHLLAFAEKRAIHPLALRQARLYRLLGQWPEANAALAKADSRNPDSACEHVALFALQGMASLSGRERGNPLRELFRRILKAAPLAQHCDHFCELAEACLRFQGDWSEDHRGVARGFAEQALHRDPRSPRAFRSYVLASLIEATDQEETIRALRPRISKALELSLGRARQQVYVPWAYFDAALFSFLETSISRVPSDRPRGEPDPELMRSYEYLLEGIELWRCPPGQDGQREHSPGASSPYPLIAYHRLLGTLVKHLDGAAKREAAFMQDMIALALYVYVPEFGASGSTPIPLAAILPGPSGHQAPCPIPAKQAGDRFVILAGACADQFREALAWYKRPLKEAFKDFAGALAAGGTTSGVSGIAATLGTVSRLHRRGYVEDRRIYRDHPWKAAKELVRVHGEESTPCEVMAYWRDALLAGYRPGNAGQYGAAAGDVLLLGIDGGVISTFEYKLAVVLGARVGLVEDRELLALRGGGACSAWKAMTGHSVWNTAPNFYPLPKDPQVLYMFLRMPAAPWPQDASLRTSLAKLAHENYRATVLRTPSVIDQALSAWDDLPKTWRKANVAQVASLQHVLAAAGLLLMPKPEADALLESREYEEVKGPTPREIEVLARLEHARWCVERLAEGWRYGPARDNVRKLRPQLVSWDRLVREQHPIETEKDRAVARGITEALKHLHSGKNTHLLLRRKGK